MHYASVNIQQSTTTRKVQNYAALLRRALLYTSYILYTVLLTVTIQAIFTSTVPITESREH
jgi:hypothetical protein